MSLNQIAASNFTTLLVADPANGATGTMTKVGANFVSALVEFQSTDGAFLIPRMTSTQRDALVTVVDGMMIFNLTTNVFNLRQGSAWAAPGQTGNVVGPVSSTDNAVARFDGAGGLTLQNSVVLIADTGAITGAFSIASAPGFVGTPAFTFTGDLNTGMWSPGSDQLALSTTGVQRIYVDALGNVGIGVGAFGTSAAGVLGLANATAPSTGPADMLQIYSSDRASGSGNTTVAWRGEGNGGISSVSPTSPNRTVEIVVNGTSYFLAAKTTND